ncbi:MAG: hypothetical protein WC575_00690 [Patescibacteria group bacterium]
MRITYDANRDLKNWFRIKENYPETFTIIKYYPFDKNIPLNHEKFNAIVKTISVTDIKSFDELANGITLEWKKIEKKVTSQIFDYLGGLKSINFKVNLTTAYLMPYDERDNWFMIPTHKSITEQLRCIAHELFHLYHYQKNPSASQKERELEVQKFLQFLAI